MRSIQRVTVNEIGALAEGRYLEVGLHGGFTQPELVAKKREGYRIRRATPTSVVMLDSAFQEGSQWGALSLAEETQGFNEDIRTALVVRRDQAGFWGDYCKAIAKRGIISLLFLDSEKHLAHRWAARHALLNASE